jgi:hypothetical protein
MTGCARDDTNPYFRSTIRRSALPPLICSTFTGM